MRQFTEKTLLIATHNAGKLEEFRQIMTPLGITVTSAAEHNLPEPEETETTFVGNARIKAHAAAKATGLPALADDSGLEVMALDGAPGVYTADWAETPTGRNFSMAMEKTHAKLIAAGAPNRGRPAFAARWFWLGPTGMTKSSKAMRPANWSGPAVDRMGTAMTPCSSPPLKPALLPKCRQMRRTSSPTAAKPLLP